VRIVSLRIASGKHRDVPLLALLIIATAAGLAAWRLARRVLPDAAASIGEEAREQLTPWRRRLRGRLDPGVATGLALTAGALVLVVGGILVALLALLLRQSGTLVEVDRWAARWGNDHAGHLSTLGLKAVTSLGSGAGVTALAVLVAAVEVRRRWSRWIVPFLVVVTLGDSIVTNLIKQAMDRARPAFNPDAAALGPSFPSGHSSQAAAFFAGAALLLSRRRGRAARAVLVGVAVGLAVAVACSRVLLDFHWVSDVVAGLSLGWAWFALCAIAFGWRMLEFGAPAEAAVQNDTRQHQAAGTSAAGTEACRPREYAEEQP
jgi:undecaprenyl-diphosphatase